MDFFKSLAIAASGLHAQIGRMEIISENIANADSPRKRGRRSVPAQDRDLYVRARPLARRPSGQARPRRTRSFDFTVKHEPGNPAADANGDVKYPNVNALVEMTDLRDAQRSYEANLNIITATRRMLQRTLDILKG